MEERQKTRIELTERPEFPATHDGMLITSNDLCRHVNTLMRNVFADFVGSKVYVDQQNVNGQVVINPLHPVQLELYFNVGGATKTTDDKKVLAFRSIQDKINDSVYKGGSNNIIQRTIGMNIAVSTNKCSEITQDGIDILGDLLWNDVAANIGKLTPKVFNDRGITVEGSTTQAAGPYNPTPQKVVYNIVRQIDIDKILAMMFDNGEEPIVYQTKPIKPVDYVQKPDGTTRWLIEVSRLNLRNYTDLCNSIGLYNTGSGINFVTETFKN